MATEARKFVDVWIVDSNTVYRDVPYTVVCDWIQQGRLLENDQLRPSGTSDWHILRTVPAFAVFLPKVEKFRAEDKAEALEPVEIDFGWKRPKSDDDDDVDMIPLIDVSLVLLIFFMMTASVGGKGSAIKTPIAREGTQVVNDPKMIWIGIDLDANDRTVYSLGLGDSAPAPEDDGISERALLDRLAARLVGAGKPDIRIKAVGKLKYEVIRAMTIKLESFRARGLIGKTKAEVREAKEQ